MKQYEEEFKRQSVKHVFQTGKAVAQVARELGISVNTLHGWIKKYSNYIERIKGFETILSNSIKYSTIEWT
ncbi:transposase, partial [Bacillus thuringiensis]